MLQQLGIHRKHARCRHGHALRRSRDPRRAGRPRARCSACVWRPSDRLHARRSRSRLPPPELFPEGHERAALSHARRRPARLPRDGRRQPPRDEPRSTSARASRTTNTFLHLRYARDTALEAGEARHVTGSAERRAASRTPPRPSSTTSTSARRGSRPRTSRSTSAPCVARRARRLARASRTTRRPASTSRPRSTGTMTSRARRATAASSSSGGSTVYVSFPASIDGEVRARLPARSRAARRRALGGPLAHAGVRRARVRQHVPRRTGIPEWTLRAARAARLVRAVDGRRAVDVGERFRFGARVGFETARCAPSERRRSRSRRAALTLDARVQLARLGPVGRAAVVRHRSASPTITVLDSAFDPRFALDCIDERPRLHLACCEAVRNGYAIADRRR